MQYDFRDIYGTILKDWLGLKTNEVTNVIHSNVQILPLFKSGCNITTATDEEDQANEFQIKLSPNPANHILSIDLSGVEGQTNINGLDCMRVIDS